MTQKEEAYQEIASLVERFSEQYDSYKKADYNETLTRRDFIDPFFKALGWDIDNKNGYSEAYREVIHEDKVKVGKATKAPDYSFRLVGGKRLFFVEAKKPNVFVKGEILPAYQVRRYGWSAKLAVSIITDFEEFAIYDCTKKPLPADKASVARIRYLTFNDYLNEFDFIWDTFSKEKVLKGSFDKFVQSDTYKKGTATVDKEFLQSLDSWRTYLATSISRNNKQLGEDEINFAVQQTIDRIIFLRIAEDRSVEPYGTLKDAIKSGEFYKNLYRQFELADDKYNSGLFDFKKDKISKSLVIENKIVKTIINELYYPESPYEFSVLSVEILGSAYEQFLGKVIRITPGHIAKVEEKPEVRKAGGVYYTTQYVVEYIVKNTVGKLIEGKTPKEISKIKIVDPACGSGSFLIGAYQYLLDWHKNYYTGNGKISKGSKNNPLTPEGNLTTAEKKRILLNNIFGVDIDVNAVEVTKLSLLLKCMEGETEASIATQLKLFHERVLPTLDENIKSGNSLIDTDFYDNQLDFGEDKKIKPFNWQKGFAEVFKQGGFDVVIGNPPYVQPIVLDFKSQNYLMKKFTANTDLYSIFIEQSLNLLKTGNDLGFIVPSLFLKGVRYQNLRNIVNISCKNVLIVEQGDNVFKNVKMPTCVILLSKGENKSKADFFKNKNIRLFEKIKTIQLGEISKIKRGLEIGKDKLVDKGTIRCLSGGNLDVYTIKGHKYIDKETYKTFSKDEEIFKSPKIMIRETGNKFFATIDYYNSITTRSIYNTQIEDKNISAEFILGVINSSMFRFYFKQFISPETNIFPKIRIAQIKDLPMPRQADKMMKQEIEKLVNLLLQLNQEKAETKLTAQISQLQAKIGFCETRINEIVYQLYGLTKSEIKIVEGK
ncbi:MAG: N-6 DNA methylase [Bacteroidia bacterium]|nr:N-6 DNA methylase [Bacteroidia bacterium]